MRFSLKNWRSLGNKGGDISPSLAKRGEGRFFKNVSLIFITFSLLFLFSGFSLAGSKPIAAGARFPNLSFQNSLSGKEQAYLGMSREKSFTVSNIQGTLFIFEVFSTYCGSCPRNVPILNQVYSRIERDAKLKGKVKVIGISVGNNQKEVESFKKEYKVLYPLLADPNFVAHKALGNPRVPYTISVRRDARGKGVVVSTHQGVINSAESVMKDIRVFLKCDPSAAACKFELKEK